MLAHIIGTANKGVLISGNAPYINPTSRLGMWLAPADIYHKRARVYVLSRETIGVYGDLIMILRYYIFYLLKRGAINLDGISSHLKGNVVSDPCLHAQSLHQQHMHGTARDIWEKSVCSGFLSDCFVSKAELRHSDMITDSSVSRSNVLRTLASKRVVAIVPGPCHLHHPIEYHLELPHLNTLKLAQRHCGECLHFSHLRRYRN